VNRAGQYTEYRERKIGQKIKKIKKITNKKRGVLRFGELYSGTCLTTEEET
jgi:hypothetical protein